MSDDNEALHASSSLKGGITGHVSGEISDADLPDSKMTPSQTETLNTSIGDIVKPDPIVFSRSAETMDTGLEHKLGSQRPDRLHARRSIVNRRNGATDQHPSSSRTITGKGIHAVIKTGKIRVSKSCTTECEILRPDYTTVYAYPGITGYSSLYEEILKNDDFSIFPGLENIEDMDEFVDDVPISNSTALEVDNDDSDLKSEVSDNSSDRLSPSRGSVKSETRSGSSREGNVIHHGRPSTKAKRYKKESDSAQNENSAVSDATEASTCANCALDTPFVTKDKAFVLNKEFESRDVSCNMWSGVKSTVAETDISSESSEACYPFENTNDSVMSGRSQSLSFLSDDDTVSEAAGNDVGSLNAAKTFGEGEKYQKGRSIDNGSLKPTDMRLKSQSNEYSANEISNHLQAEDIFQRKFTKQEEFDWKPECHSNMATPPNSFIDVTSQATACFTDYQATFDSQGIGGKIHKVKAAPSPSEIKEALTRETENRNLAGEKVNDVIETREECLTKPLNGDITAVFGLPGDSAKKVEHFRTCEGKVQKQPGHMRASSPTISILSLSDVNKSAKDSRYPRRDHNDVCYGDTRIDGCEINLNTSQSFPKSSPACPDIVVFRTESVQATNVMDVPATCLPGTSSVIQTGLEKKSEPESMKEILLKENDTFLPLQETSIMAKGAVGDNVSCSKVGDGVSSRKVETECVRSASYDRSDTGDGVTDGEATDQIPSEKLNNDSKPHGDIMTECGVEIPSSQEDEETVRIKAPAPHAPAEYLSFLNVLRNKKLVKKEVRRPKITKNRREKTALQAIQNELQDGMQESSEELQIGSNSNTFPKGREVPPNWTPCKSSSAGGNGKRPQGSGKKRRRGRGGKSQCSYEKLYSGVSSRNQTPYSHYLSTSRSGSTITITPDPSGYSLRGGSRPTLSSSEDEKDIEGLDYDLCSQDFEFKRLYYERIGRMAKKDNSGDTKSKNSPKQKRITSQVNLLKTIDDYCNAEDNSEREFETLTPEKTYFESDAHASLAKYYASLKTQVSSTAGFARPEPQLSASYVRIRKISHHVPSALDSDRLKSLGQRTACSQAMWDHSILYPYRTDVELEAPSSKLLLQRRANRSISKKGFRKTNTKLNPKSNKKIDSKRPKPLTAATSKSSQQTSRLNQSDPSLERDTTQNQAVGNVVTCNKSENEGDPAIEREELQTDAISSVRKSLSFENGISFDKNSPGRQRQGSSQKGKEMTKPRMKVRFADERLSLEKNPLPCDRSEEDTWCYSVNAMLLRANKVLQESELPRKSDHRFPRPDSAKVVAPVVHKEPKSSSFLSELLRQDKIERMQAVKQEMAEIREREKAKKAQEKENEKLQSCDENNSKYGLTVRHSPFQKKSDGKKSHPDFYSNQIQLSCTNFEENRQTAETFRIRAAMSQNAKERAIRVCKTTACRSNSPPSYYSPPLTPTVYPKKLIPLRIARPLDLQNPDKRSHDHVHMSGCGAFHTLDSGSSTKSGTQTHSGTNDCIKLSKRTNFLLDQHSEILRYYEYPHMNQRPSAIVQLYGDIDRNGNHVNDMSHQYTGSSVQWDILIFTPTCCTCLCVKKDVEMSDNQNFERRVNLFRNVQDENSVICLHSLTKSYHKKVKCNGNHSRNLSFLSQPRQLYFNTRSNEILNENKANDSLQTEHNCHGLQSMTEIVSPPNPVTIQAPIGAEIMADYFPADFNSNAIPKDSEERKANHQQPSLHDQLSFSNARAESSLQDSGQQGIPPKSFGKKIQQDFRSSKGLFYGHMSGKDSRSTLSPKRFPQCEERLETILSSSDLNVELSVDDQSSSEFSAGVSTKFSSQGPKLQYGAPDDPDAICIENVMDVFDQVYKKEKSGGTNKESTGPIFLGLSGDGGQFATVGEIAGQSRCHIAGNTGGPDLEVETKLASGHFLWRDKEESNKEIDQRDLVQALLKHPINQSLKSKERFFSPEPEFPKLRELMLRQEPEDVAKTSGDSRSVPFIVNYKDRWSPDYKIGEETASACTVSGQQDEQGEPVYVTDDSKTVDDHPVVSDNFGGDVDTEKTSVCSGDHLDEIEEKNSICCPGIPQTLLRPYSASKIRPLSFEIISTRIKNQKRPESRHGMLRVCCRDEFFVRGYPVRLVNKHPCAPVSSHPRENLFDMFDAQSHFESENSDTEPRTNNVSPAVLRGSSYEDKDSFQPQEKTEDSPKSVPSTYDNVPMQESEKESHFFNWHQDDTPPNFHTDNVCQDRCYEELSVAWADAFRQASRHSAYSSSSSSSVALKETPDLKLQNAGDSMLVTPNSCTTEIREPGEGDTAVRSTSDVKEGNTVSQISDEFADEVDTDGMGDGSKSGTLKASLESFPACYSKGPNSLLNEDTLKSQSERTALLKDSLRQFMESLLRSEYLRKTKSRPPFEKQPLDNGSFPSRDFLKTLRGSDLLKTLIQDRGRLLSSLENLTRYCCFIPVFQAKSIKSEEMMPLVLHVNYCATYDKDKYRQTYSKPLRTMPVFYCEESGLLHRIYTVHHITEGLYSLEDTETPDKNNNLDYPDSDEYREVRTGRLVQYAPDAAHLAFEKNRVLLIGDEVDTRDQALDLLVRTCDEARGKGTSMFYKLTIGWVPVGVEQDKTRFLPPVTKTASVDSKVWCPACKSPFSEETTCIKGLSTQGDMTMNSSMAPWMNSLVSNQSLTPTKKTILCLRCGITMGKDADTSCQRSTTKKNLTSCPSDWIVTKAGHAIRRLTSKPENKLLNQRCSPVSTRQSHRSEVSLRVRSAAEGLTSLPKINYLKSQQSRATTPLEKSQSLPHIRFKDWWWHPTRSISKSKRRYKVPVQSGGQGSGETGKLPQLDKGLNKAKVSKSVRFSRLSKDGKSKRQTGDEAGLIMGRKSWSSPIIPPPFPMSLKKAEHRRLHSTKSDFLSGNIKRFSKNYVSPYWTKKEVRHYPRIQKSLSGSSSSSSSSSSSDSSDEEEDSSSESVSDSEIESKKSGRPKSIDDIFKKLLPRLKSSMSFKHTRDDIDWRRSNLPLGEEYRQLKAAASNEDQRRAHCEPSDHSEYDMCSDADEAKRLWKLCYPPVDFFHRRRRFKKRKSHSDDKF